MMKFISIMLVIQWSWFPAFAAGYDDSDDFPYKLNWKMELPLAALGLGVLGLSLQLEDNLNTLNENEIESLDKHDINALDRCAVENWSKSAADWSDAGLIAVSILSPALQVSLMLQEKWNQALTLAVIYAETIVINIGLTNATKALVQRKRPFLYNPSISMDERLEAGTEGLKSFFSGHASMTFCSAVFLSTVVDDIYPEAKWRYAVWAASLTLATTTAYLRYAAGVHYPTDLLTGALIGSLVGFSVPKLHKQDQAGGLDVAFVPRMDGSFFGIGMVIWSD